MFFRKYKPIPKNRVADSPTQLYIELSTFCNLACRTCVRNSVVDFEPAYFSLELLGRLMDSIPRIKTLKRIVLLGYGEALCNPHINVFLESLSRTGIPLVLVTNGQLMTKALIDLMTTLLVQEIFLSWDDYESADKIRIGSDTSLIQAVIKDLKKKRQGDHPTIGLEIVALKRNHHTINRIIKSFYESGGERIIITNIFPYTDYMKDEILFTYKKTPKINLHKRIHKNTQKDNITIASQIIGDICHCPFIERGTLFITAQGDVVPCIELAHTHKAWYFNASRMHYQYTLGNISNGHLHEIWNAEEFISFRDKFIYYDFPDCLNCLDPEMCYHRSVRGADCYQNQTPCGECLWARGAILCP